jgi:hypothetical protein
MRRFLSTRDGWLHGHVCGVHFYYCYVSYQAHRLARMGFPPRFRGTRLDLTVLVVFIVIPFILVRTIVRTLLIVQISVLLLRILISTLRHIIPEIEI